MGKTHKRRVRRSRAFWQTTVNDFHSSGMSQSAFARQHDLNISTLSSWLRKLAKHEPLALAQPQFVQVVPQTPQHHPVHINTRLILGHATLEFAQLPSPDFLAKLLRAVC